MLAFLTYLCSEYVWAAAEQVPVQHSRPVAVLPTRRAAIRLSVLAALAGECFCTAGLAAMCHRLMWGGLHYGLPVAGCLRCWTKRKPAKTLGTALGTEEPSPSNTKQAESTHGLQ